MNTLCKSVLATSTKVNDPPFSLLKGFLFSAQSDPRPMSTYKIVRPFVAYAVSSYPYIYIHVYCTFRMHAGRSYSLVLTLNSILRFHSDIPLTLFCFHLASSTIT